MQNRGYGRGAIPPQGINGACRMPGSASAARDVTIGLWWAPNARHMRVRTQGMARTYVYSTTW